MLLKTNSKSTGKCPSILKYCQINGLFIKSFHSEAAADFINSTTKASGWVDTLVDPLRFISVGWRKKHRWRCEAKPNHKSYVKKSHLLSSHCRVLTQWVHSDGDRASSNELVLCRGIKNGCQAARHQWDLLSSVSSSLRRRTGRFATRVEILRTSHFDMSHLRNMKTRK